MGDRSSLRWALLPLLISAGSILVGAAGRPQDRAQRPEAQKPAASRMEDREESAELGRLGAELRRLRSAGDLAGAAQVFARMFRLETASDPDGAYKIGPLPLRSRILTEAIAAKDLASAPGLSPVFFSPEEERNPAAATWTPSLGSPVIFVAAELWAAGRPRDIGLRRSPDGGRSWDETVVLGDGRPWSRPAVQQITTEAVGLVFVREWDSADGDIFFARLSEDLAADAEFPIALGRGDERNPSLATDFGAFPSPYLYIVYAEHDGLSRTVKFRVSPDLGVSWSRPVTIAAAMRTDPFEIETSLAYDPERNALLAAFTWPRGPSAGIAVAASRNFGASWSRPVFVTPRDGGPCDAPRIASRQGQAVVVYEQATAGGGFDIGLASSSDSGRRWTTGGSLAAAAAAERFPDIRAAEGPAGPRLVASFVEDGTKVRVQSREAAGLGAWTTDLTVETGGPILSGAVAVVPRPAADGSRRAGVVWAGGTPDADVVFGSADLLSLAELVVTPGDRMVGFTAGTTTFEVSKTGEGPVEWTAAVTSGQEWLTIASGGSGTDAGTIVADFQENPGVAARVGSIQVTAADVSVPSVTVTVTQAGAPGLEVTPAEGLVSTGPRGGPFVPAFIDYTLRNTSGEHLSWTASEGRTWLRLSQTSGGLDPGASIVVTLSLTSAADSLNEGTYNTTVTFTNRTSGFGNTSRPVHLTVTGPAGSLAVSPTGGLASEGFAGGPFSPSALTYTLHNPGSTSIDWTAAATEPWTSLSETAGALGPGASVTVTVSINEAAASLAVGSYGDTVTFTNTTSGTGSATRPVTLTVLAPPGSLAVSPAEGLDSAGPEGGPFVPVSRAYTLQNTGGSRLSWTASKSQPWTSLSAASGTLDPGETAMVTVSITAAAEALPIGDYGDAVSFHNATTGRGDTTRPVTLTIRPGPALSVSPLNRDVPFTAGTTTFSVANAGAGTMAWTATVVSGSDWLSIQSGASGTNAGTITAAFQANRTSAARMGTIRVTAPGAAGSPRDVTVSQAKGSFLLTLSGQRLVERAWIIEREFGRLTVAIDNPASVPVETFIVYRRAAGGGESIIQQIDGAAVTGSPLIVNDAFLEPGIAYTYRVEAVDAFGARLAVSNEITI